MITSAHGHILYKETHSEKKYTSKDFRLAEMIKKLWIRRIMKETYSSFKRSRLIL